MNQANIQTQFVELLWQLTIQGGLTWSRSQDDPGFVYCLAGDDLIVFEVRGGQDAELVQPSHDVSGIVSKCRNVSFLWLEGLHGWNRLIELLIKAPDDDSKVTRMKRKAQLFPLQALAALQTKPDEPEI